MTAWKSQSALPNRGEETLDADVATSDGVVAFAHEEGPPTLHGSLSPTAPATQQMDAFDSQMTADGSLLTAGASLLTADGSLLTADASYLASASGNGIGGLMPPPGDPLIGRFINNLQVLSRLGSGGFGAVYLAEHTELRTPFAIKILNQFQSKRPEVVERFRREARAVALLNHPNIVKIADFGWLDGYGYYLAMEYLEGASLKDVLDEEEGKGLVSLERVHDWMRQLCGALRLVHHKGIVHRDLKPSNIILVAGQRTPEVVKLIDFGIASVSDDASLTASGVCMGSPAYMSPEQADGRSSSLDARSDLYSLGIILYHILAGELPFIGRGLASYVRLHLLEPVPALAVRCPQRQWHPELEALIQRVLAKKPDDRPADIDAFWRECNKALEAQKQLAAIAPVPETRMLPSPKTIAGVSIETLRLPDASGDQVTQELGLLGELGGVSMPEDPAVLHDAARHPGTSSLVEPPSDSALIWIAMLLAIFVLFAGAGMWWLASGTVGTQKQASARVAPRAIPGTLPQQRQTPSFRRTSLPKPTVAPMPRRSFVMNPQPKAATVDIPPKRRPSVTLTRPSPVRPRPKRVRKRRRRRYRRRRRRFRRRRKRRRRRRKSKNRDVFGFDKDPV